MGAELFWTFAQGDTPRKTVTLMVNGIKQNLVTGDKVTLTVKRLATDTTAVLTKEITSFVDGSAEISLAKADTVDLDARSYRYDLVITLATGEEYSVIKDSELRLIRKVKNKEVV